jgi:class 3 adenylate cyclase/tetratricopeptide (TPR) repeat protein
MSAPAGRARAETVRATVMFADLLGFAELARELGTERAYLVVTPCLRILDEVARKYGGSVDKYSGDKLLGVFGTPLPLEDHTRAAARAALEMRRRVVEYASELGVALELRAGLNTGEVVAGDIRGPVVREFHVLGDVVNTAARICAKAAPGEIYVGEATFEATRERLAYRALPPFALKGKSRPVPAFALLGGDAVEEGGLGQEGAGAALVGRERELALLREAAAELRAGKGGVIALIGPEGSGKSRLLAELARAPELAGARLLQLRCAQVDRGAPGRAAAELAKLVLGRELGALDGVAGALPELLAVLAERPHVLAFEDAHLLDAEPLALLEVALAHFGERPLLVLLSLRAGAGAARARLAEAAARSGARWREIELGPLDAEAAEALLDALGSEALDEATRALVRERAAGSPGRLVLGAFGAAALRSERELEEREEKRRERTREAERRRVAVLYADISGFTAMTEQKGAGEAYPVVAGALHLLDEIARKHGGTVDHFLGDCVMALFGVPEAIEDAPRAAVNAAIEMRERIEAYNDERGLAPRLAVHSGIATGQGIAGDISGPLIREYAVMGEHVDRADGLTHEAERGEIYADAETHQATADVFEYEAGRPVALAGAAPLASFAVRSRQVKLHRARLGVERRVFSELVGRESELGALREALAALGAGRGGIVHLLAEAGVGKSRLLAELAKDEVARGLGWLEGRSLSTGRNLAYHPFADLLRSWAGIRDEEGAEAERARIGEALAALLPDTASELLPFLLRLQGLDSGDERRLAELPPDALERMSRRALGELLRGEARRRPLVVVMDDLHWADRSSIELLEALLRLADEERLLFVVAARPGWPETSGRILERARAQHAERNLELALAPLGPEAVRRMVRNLFRGGDVPYATRTLIEERARGNPFYIEEVVRSLVDQGAVEYRDGAFHATRALESVEIPGTVQEVVMARVDRLAPERKSVLQAASVVGGTFHTVVLDAMGAGDGRLGDRLAELCEAEFLVPSDRSRGEEYSFKHPLLQEVTYDALLQARREALHRAAGEAIEQRLLGAAPGIDAMLAYHFGRGGVPERAEEYLFRAGDEAARSAASSEALHFFQEASKLYLQLHGEAGDPTKKSRLEKSVGLALFNGGREPDAVEHFDRALEHLGVPVPQSALRNQLRFGADLLAVLWRLYLPSGRARPAASEREQEIIEIMFQRALSQSIAAPTRFLFDSLAALRRIARLDAQTVHGAGRKYAGTVGIFSYGGVSFGIGQRFLAQADRLLGDRPDSPDFLYYRTMRFIHHFLAGDWSEAHEVPEAVLEEQQRAGRLWEVATYLGFLAEKHSRRGEFERARAAVQRSFEIADAFDYHAARLSAMGTQAMVLLEQGRSAEAAAMAEDYYEESPQDLLHLLALALRADAKVQAGALEEAAESLARGDAILAGMRMGQAIPWHVSFHNMARLHAELAAWEAGTRRSAARLRRSRRAALGSVRKVAGWRPAVFRLTAREAWLRGSRSKSEHWWRRALAEAERLGARPEQARTLHEIGLRIGPGGSGPDGRSGAECLEAAQRLYAELHLERDLERLRAAAEP